LVLKEIEYAFDSNNKELLNKKCDEFLNLILAQDYLLSCRKEFMVGNWIESARKMGKTRKERDLYEWNAKVQITTWGDRNASENGGLRDYAHKEWNGILKDLYYNRWKLFFDCLKNGKNLDNFDWYSFDEYWIKNKKSYPNKPYNNIIDIAKDILLLIND